MSLTKEQVRDRILIIILPVLITVIVFLLLNRIVCKEDFDINKIEGKDAIELILGIWGTLLGFILTAESILTAFQGSGSELTKLLITSGHMRNVLFSYMITCISLFFSLCIFIPIIIFNVWNILIMKILVICISMTMCNVGISIMFLFIMLGGAPQKEE